MLVACTKAATESQLSVRTAGIFCTGRPPGNVNLNPGTLAGKKDEKGKERTKISVFLSLLETSAVLQQGNP